MSGDSKVRCKMLCLEAAPFADGYEIKLAAVADGSDENREFFKWTPNGTVTLSIVSEAAARPFVAGKSYYLDFIPAD